MDCLSVVVVLLGANSHAPVCVDRWVLACRDDVQMRELDTVDAQPVVLPHDFKAYSRVSIDNHNFNKCVLFHP